MGDATNAMVNLQAQRGRPRSYGKWAGRLLQMNKQGPLQGTLQRS